MAMLEEKYDTIIIGGGISGIASALRRHKKGDKVLLLEKSNQLGGKLGVYKWQDYIWDKGPSLFTLPHLIVELFELFGKDYKEYFNFQEMEENCRYFFEKDLSFTFFKDPLKRRNELQKIFSDKEIDQIENYLKSTEKIYDQIGELFIAKPKLSLKDMFKLEVVKQYPKLLSKQMLNSLNDYNEKWFSNDNLVQLFNRFGTYNGSNPYQMSGLYSMIPHLELNLGTFFPVGGMRSIIDSLENLMTELDVEFHMNCGEIKAVDSENGVTLELFGNKVSTKRLVSSIDHLVFYKDIYNDVSSYKKHLTEPRSTSAIVFYWAIDKKYPQIGLHNMLFSSDYKKEFDEIFGQNIIPEAPSIYIHNSSCIEQNQAPENGQNWFLMINTPAGIEPNEQQLSKVRQYIVDRIRSLVKIDFSEHIVHEQKWTMKGIEEDTGSVLGALYGGAFNTKLASFKRHGNQSKKNKNIYFTGGSVHPGGGIPLVLKSAKIVDDLIDLNESN